MAPKKRRLEIRIVTTLFPRLLFLSPGYLNRLSRCLFHLRLLHSLLPQKPKQTISDENTKMQFNAPTFHVPPTVPERRYTANVVVEYSLRVWAISSWRGTRELAELFLRAGFHHLPLGSLSMFCLEEQCPHATAPPVGLAVHFTNRFDAYYLLGQVFWCGCEFIAFTIYNIFTDFDSIFPAANRMQNLSYYLGENGLEEEQNM
jgi:hypothetical protein